MPFLYKPFTLLIFASLPFSLPPFHLMSHFPSPSLVPHFLHPPQCPSAMLSLICSPVGWLEGSLTSSPLQGSDVALFLLLCDGNQLLFKRALSRWTTADSQFKCVSNFFYWITNALHICTFFKLFQNQGTLSSPLGAGSPECLACFGAM